MFESCRAHSPNTRPLIAWRGFGRFPAMTLSRRWKIALGVIVALIAIYALAFAVYNIGETEPGTGTGDVLTSTAP